VEEVPIHDFAHLHNQVEPLFRPELERNMVIWSQAPMQHNIQYLFGSPLLMEVSWEFHSSAVIKLGWPKTRPPLPKDVIGRGLNIQKWSAQPDATRWIPQASCRLCRQLPSPEASTEEDMANAMIDGVTDECNSEFLASPGATVPPQRKWP
jgi:hypothetical protein